jgi:hypothetical protein
MEIGKSPKIRKHQDKPKTQNVLMMNTKIAQTLSHKQFKRRFGVQRDTFKEMLKVLRTLGLTLNGSISASRTSCI